MPVKSKASEILVERSSPVRKAKTGTARAAVAAMPGHRPDTKELLQQIKIRGERLSAEIEELLVRMG